MHKDMKLISECCDMSPFGPPVAHPYELVKYYQLNRQVEKWTNIPNKLKQKNQIRKLIVSCPKANARDTNANNVIKYGLSKRNEKERGGEGERVRQKENRRNINIK